MRAGPLDRRVVVQTRVAELDANGQPIETWVALFATWAQVTPLGGSERIQAAQTMAARTSLFRVRRRKDWLPSEATHRLSYDDRIWDVTGIRELGRLEGYEIQAQAQGG